MAASLCLSLCVPAFACDHDTMGCVETVDSIITEDELGELLLAQLPLPIVTREDPNAACGISSHMPPANYRYSGCTHGDTQVEIFITGAGATLVGLIPGLGELMAALTIGVGLSNLVDYLDDGMLLGEYYKYTWTNGSHSFHHIVWVSDYDNDGYDEYLTCKIVQS